MLYKLYLDESGTPDLTNFNKNFPYFIMSGFIVNEEQAKQLKIKADQVKFKYWGRTNIVFHSREIGRKENDFFILQDPNIEKSFHKDLVTLLVSNGGSCIVVAVNKNKAKALGWKDIDVYRNTSREILRFFIEYLASKGNKGQIIIESAGTDKDILFYKEYIYFLAEGISIQGISHHKMKTLLTSISFVIKNNLDIETQIADLLAYPAVHDRLVFDGTRMAIPKSYEDTMSKILNNKILKYTDKKTKKIREGFVNLIP